MLVVLDVDSTLINEEGLDLFAAHAGDDVGVAIRELTDAAMAGHSDFASSLRERVALLRGQPVSLLDTVARMLTPTLGARQLIDGVHERGGVVAAVSGGFHEIADSIISSLGVDRFLANRFEAQQGYLTGQVAGDVVDARAKADFLRQVANECDVPMSHTLAVGDGANDVVMFEAAAVSVSFCGKAVANQAATVSLSERNLARVLDFLPDGV